MQKNRDGLCALVGNQHALQRVAVLQFERDLLRAGRWRSNHWSRNDLLTNQKQRCSE